MISFSLITIITIISCGEPTAPETQLQPYHLEILEFIGEKGFIADHDYAKLTDRAKATRALDFQKLTELKLIGRKGKGRATYYVLREK